MMTSAHPLLKINRSSGGPLPDAAPLTSVGPSPAALAWHLSPVALLPGAAALTRYLLPGVGFGVAAPPRCGIGFGAILPDAATSAWILLDYFFFDFIVADIGPLLPCFFLGFFCVNW